MRKARVGMAIITAAVLTASCTGTNPGGPTQTPPQVQQPGSETTQEYTLAPITELTLEDTSSLESGSKTAEPVVLEPSPGQPNGREEQPTRDATREEQARNAPRERPTARPERPTTATSGRATERTRAPRTEEPTVETTAEITSEQQAAIKRWEQRKGEGGEDWLIAGIVERDRSCFPQSVRSNEDVRGYLDYLDRSGKQTLTRCLSDDAEWALHLLQNEGSEMNGAEEFCMWRATRVADGRYEEGPEHPGLSRPNQSDGRRLAEMAVITYCTRERVNPLDERAGAESAGEQRARILTCLVDNIGGPARFMAANLERSTVLAEFEEARKSEGPCRTSR